jgi:hypothetical protein
MASGNMPELEAPISSKADDKDPDVEERNSAEDTDRDDARPENIDKGGVEEGVIEQGKTTHVTQGIEVTASHDASKPASEKGKNYSSFTAWEKRFIVFTATIAAMFSPFTAQIYFPALNTLAKDLHVTNAKINLTVTTYMVCFPSSNIPY